MQNTLPDLKPNTPSGSYAAAANQMPSLLKAAKTGKPATAIVVLLKLLAPLLLTACMWTQIWLGAAGAIGLCLCALVLMIIVPKLLPSTLARIDWARQVGYGEKIWLNRIFIPVPQGLNYRLTTLYLVFWAGVLVALWGAFAALPLLSATGLAVAYSAQATCFAKLIQLYKLMRERHPLYRFWANTPINDNRPLSARREKTTQN